MQKLLSIALPFLLLLCWSQPGKAADESRPCDAEPTNMRIAYGDVIACSLSTGVDSDSFTFNGTIGQKVIIQVTNPGAYLINTCLELFAPSGARVAGGCDGFYTRIGAPVFMLGESGIWRIIVSEDGVDNAGPYTLTLARVAPSAAPASPIEYDVAPLADTLDPSVDLDLFTFQGQQDAQVRIVIANPGAYLINTCLELFAPDGTHLIQCGGFSTIIDQKLLQTGIYRIVVSEDGVDNAGPYTLSLVCRVPPPGSDRCDEPPTCRGLEVTILGTNNDDTIRGTGGNDVIAGLGGNDVIYGLGGDDVICGGPGHDTIFGGAGNDQLFGDQGADLLFGEGGNDTMRGGGGRDVLFGGSGNDRLFGDGGDDLLLGGSGDDRLNGGGGTDVCDDINDLNPAQACEITL